MPWFQCTTKTDNYSCFTSTCSATVPWVAFFYIQFFWDIWHFATQIDRLSSRISKFVLAQIIQVFLRGCHPFLFLCFVSFKELGLSTCSVCWKCFLLILWTECRLYSSWAIRGCDIVKCTTVHYWIFSVVMIWLVKPNSEILLRFEIISMYPQTQIHIVCLPDPFMTNSPHQDANSHDYWGRDNACPSLSYTNVKTSRRRNADTTKIEYSVSRFITIIIILLKLSVVCGSLSLTLLEMLS